MLSFAEMKAWLNASDTDQVILEDLEARAVAFIQAQTDRYFGEEQDFVEIMDGSGLDVLWLSEAPSAIDAVYERVGTVWTEFDSSEYEYDGRQLFNIEGGWSKGRRNIKVEYTAGYELGSEPADIRQAVMDLIALKFQGRGSEALQSQRIGDYSYTKGDVTSVPGLSETLARWRRAWTG